MASELILVSKESKKYEVSSRFAVLSVLINNILQDFHEGEEIPLPHVSSGVLERVIEFAKHHDYTAPDPPSRPLRSKIFREVVSDPWDADFIDQLKEEELIEMILATNYLDMKSLLDLCLSKIACKFKDKSVEDIRKEYAIAEEFTAEVEESLKAEYPWALEAENQD